MKKIVQKEDKVLRKEAKLIPISEIKTAKIQKILKEMKSALKSQDDGVAIAAPQIGYSLSIFIVAGKIFDKDFFSEENTELGKKKDLPPDMVFINPVISKLSREKDWMPEGCLSVRWLYGKTHRSKKA